MKDWIIKNIINKGGYKLDEVEHKIKKLYMLGDLTDEELDELMLLAASNVDNAMQIDLYEIVADLQKRVYLLEHREEQYVVWTYGYTTKKGEIVRIDIDGDGTMEYAMYDGGRKDGTSLRPGQIDGWYVVTADGTKTHVLTYDKATKTYAATLIA